MRSSTVISIVAVFVALSTVGAWWTERDRRQNVAAFAQGKIQADSIEIALLSDSLKAVHRTGKALAGTVRKTITVYDTLRKRITFTDTSRFVIVDTAFVVAADSTKLACEALGVNCEMQRLVSQEIIARQNNTIQNLNAVIANTKPSRWQRIIDASAGAAGGYLACKVF